MPIYDFECPDCNNEFEYLAKNTVIKYAKCPSCGMKAKKIFSAKRQRFNLTFDPKKDMVDWDGNRSRYYDEYNAAKARGENVRISQLDGDG